MYIQISTEIKKKFLQWFLHYEQLKQQEATWILTYVIENEQLLKHIHFVNEAKYCPRAVVLTSTDLDQVPFLFYKEQIITDNPDKLFHDIRLNPGEPLYIQLNFKGANQHPLYARVLEENPFAPIQLHEVEQDKFLSKQLLDQLEYEHQRDSLNIQIDQALDQKDKNKFLRLVKELNDLHSSFPQDSDNF